jgi:hypothetical protein
LRTLRYLEALARSAEKQVAESAVKASQKTELEALAEQTLAMLDDVEGKSLSDLELRNAQIDDLISRYSKGEDTFDDIAEAYAKRANLTPAQVAERKAVARAEFDRMSTTEGTLLRDAYGVSVNTGKGYMQWKLMADLAVMGVSGTAIRETLERAIGVPADRQSNPRHYHQVITTADRWKTQMTRKRKRKTPKLLLTQTVHRKSYRKSLRIPWTVEGRMQQAGRMHKQKEVYDQPMKRRAKTRQI